MFSVYFFILFCTSFIAIYILCILVKYQASAMSVFTPQLTPLLNLSNHSFYYHKQHGLTPMLMFMILTSLFTQFKESYLEVQIQERYFVNQKPFYVKALKVRNVCCCWYHVELDMLQEGLNTLRSVKGGVHSHEHCWCNYKICRGEDDDDGFENYKAHKTTFTGTMVLW